MAVTPHQQGPRTGDPVRITTAPTSAAEERSGRQRRYLLSMALRVVCFIGAIVAGANWVGGVLLLGAVVLPYVAVVLANVQGPRDDGFELRTTGPSRGELESRDLPRL